MSSDNNLQSMDAAFFDEYTSHDAILKYTRATAGFGISYLLDHDYMDVYSQALERLPEAASERGIRLLEFGCGGGMNLIHLLSRLRERSVKVERAMGTDFSPALIEAARREARTYLPEGDQRKIEFHVAKNESLIEDLAKTTGTESSRWAGSFDLILGVNTIRYCHRGQREVDCARDIMTLLAPGGICVVIDMNDRFPAFRSALKNHFRKTKEEECYLPSLSEYAAPFEKTGFEILRKEHFCWIPHSAGKFLSSVMRGASPILGAIAPDRAMRSLVVIRKPLRPQP
jgi:SAM-dependent methyltransferase